MKENRMKQIMKVLAVLVSVFFVFSGNSDAGIRENIIMSKVPKKFKDWTNEYPESTYKIPQSGGYAEDPYTSEIKLVQFSYIVMEGIRVPERKLSNGNKRKAYDAVRFGWKIKVTNTSAKKCEFKLRIPLLDAEGFEIGDPSYHSYDLAPGETKIFQDDSAIKLDLIKTVHRINCVLEKNSLY
jgi:hypothetical protein